MERIEQIIKKIEEKNWFQHLKDTDRVYLNLYINCTKHNHACCLAKYIKSKRIDIIKRMLLFIEEKDLYKNSQNYDSYIEVSEK